MTKLSRVDDGEATIYLAFVESLLASGNREAAEEGTKSAAPWLIGAADKLQVAGSREAFLTRVSENRRILELARELGVAT